MARPKQYTEEWMQKEAKLLIKYAQEADIPLEKEFTAQRGYSSQRISEFANTSDEFSEALKRMKDIQETKIVKAGLAGQINTTFAIFTLKNIAGWRDGIAIEKEQPDKKHTRLVLVLDRGKEMTQEKNEGSPSSDVKGSIG